MSVYLYRKYNFSDDLGEQPMLFLKGRTDGRGVWNTLWLHTVGLVCVFLPAASISQININTDVWE